MKEAPHIFPLDKRRILPSMDQYSELNYSTDYYLFNLSGGRKKVKVLLSDILLVRAIKGGHADKLLYLKGNMVYLIRGHSLDEFTGFLLQCNKQDLVSPDAVDYLEEDTIYLRGLIDNGRPVFVTLNRTYKKAFWKFFHYSQRGH